MKKRFIGAMCLLALFVLAANVPLAAQGMEQGKDPVYIYVAEWEVPRAQWGEMTKQNDAQRPVLDKLVADGTLIGYGQFSSMIHAEGSPTHGSWFSARSQGGLLKALEAFYARPDVTSPVLANSKHWDYFLVTRHYNGHSGTFKGAYLVGGTWDVKPGQARAYTELIGKTIVPVMEQMLKDGLIHWYSVDWQNFHTDNPGRSSFVYVAANADAVDKVDKAIDAALEKHAGLGAAFGSLVDMASHRDFLLWVSNMSYK